MTKQSQRVVQQPIVLTMDQYTPPYPTGKVVDVADINVSNQWWSCDEQNACSFALKKDVVVKLRNIQILVEERRWQSWHIRSLMALIDEKLTSSHVNFSSIGWNMMSCQILFIEMFIWSHPNSIRRNISKNLSSMTVAIITHVSPTVLGELHCNLQQLHQLL